jgi:hypothetical protein
MFGFFLFVISCDKKEEIGKGLQGMDFGESVYYEPFLWVKSPTTILTKELQFEFSDYAAQEGAYLNLMFTDDHGNKIDNNLISDFDGGELMNDGIIRVMAGPTIVKKEIGIQFLPKMDAGDYHGYLVVVNSDLHRIDNFDREQINTDARIKQWSTYYEKDYNPLALGLFWLLVVIVGLLLIWFLIIRNQLYPKMKKGRIQILSPYFGGVNIDGNTKLVIFTKSAQKQSGLNKIFTGKVQYEVNPVYENDIILRPGRGNKIRIKLPVGSRITPPVMNLEKFNMYKIKLTNQIIEIQYS